MKTYEVYEQIGNFCDVVFSSDNFYEVQDFLENRLADSGKEAWRYEKS